VMAMMGGIFLDYRRKATRDIEREAQEKMVDSSATVAAHSKYEQKGENRGKRIFRRAWDEARTWVCLWLPALRRGTTDVGKRRKGLKQCCRLRDQA